MWSAILWVDEVSSEYSIKWDSGTSKWHFHDDSGAEANLYADDTGGLNPSVPTWPMRITGVVLDGVC